MSVDNYSIDDDDSNIDLVALDSEDSISNASSRTNSLSTSSAGNHTDMFNSKLSSSENSVSNSRSRFGPNSKTPKQKVSAYVPEPMKPNVLSHVSTNKSKKSTKSVQISLNDNSLASSSQRPPARYTGVDSSKYGKLPPTTRQSTYASSGLKSYESSFVTGTGISAFPSVVQNRTKTSSSDYYGLDNKDTMNEDEFGDVGQDNDDSDSYSFDYISNVKLKPGDKLKTTWSMPMQNERQYKDLQIINEVSKLQNINFFSKDYVQSLENLKISQLGLLIDMVKLTENSFADFYTLWNNFEAGDDTLSTSNSHVTSDRSSREGGANSHDDNDLLDNPKSKQAESNSKLASGGSDGIEKNSNDGNSKSASAQGDEDMNAMYGDMVTWIDINNSEGFKLMEKRKQDILRDLEKIDDSIDQIDSFTKSMWARL